MSFKEELDDEDEDIDLRSIDKCHASVLRMATMNREEIMDFLNGSNLENHNDNHNNDSQLQMPELISDEPVRLETAPDAKKWESYKLLFQQNLAVGDFIDCNPMNAGDDGWRPAEIIKIDHRARSFKVQYVKNEQDKTYWFHFDDVEHIAVFASKSMHENKNDEKDVRIKMENKAEQQDVVVLNGNRNKRRIEHNDDIPHAKRRKLNDKNNDKDWEEWNGMDIIQWIYDLDDHKFVKYIDKLSEIVCMQEINGKDLCEITEEHLLKWNVVNFGDRVALYKHIQTLTSA